MMLVFIMFCTSCQFSFPQNPKIGKYVGIYGIAKDPIYLLRINLLVVGINGTLGKSPGVGVVGTSYHYQFNYIRYFPHLSIKILPPVIVGKGIDIFILSVVI